MAQRQEFWLSRGSEARRARIGALSLSCPFCGEPLGTVLGLEIGARCNCGALVARSEQARTPAPPGLLREAFHELQRRISESVLGHDRVVSRLALIGARHLHLGGRQRALLIGPSGTGKTTMGTALARAMGCPALVWDASVSSEVGWAGVSVTDVLAEMYSAYDRDLGRMARGVLVADEIDKLATRDADGRTREHRRGQQKSLLGLLGGGVPFRFQEDGERGPTISVSTDDMLIIGLGTFDGLGPDPGPSELVSYGFSPEFVSRFSVVVSFGSLSVRALTLVLRREVAPAIEAAAEFGYDIELPDSVLSYVATVVASCGDEVTPRAGAGWLQSAIDEALLRLLDLEAKAGAVLRIREEDIPVPSAMQNRSEVPPRTTKSGSPSAAT